MTKTQTPGTALRGKRRAARGSSAHLAVAAALIALLALLGLCSPPPVHAADPPLLRQFCEGHDSPYTDGAGQCVIPRGIATDPRSGDVYVADQDNKRIQKFTAWGQFVLAWGWGVRDGAEELQSCGPGANPPSESCRAAVGGVGVGQFNGTQGVAVDSEGDVYVVDSNNHRVQKFDPEGHFLAMFGGGVDQGGGSPAHPGNLCSAEYLANGDTCGAGSVGTADGQFSEWPVASFITIDGKGTGTAADDVVYVGDKGRIQQFDAEGEYLGKIPFDGEEGRPEPGTVASLAFDPSSGDLYFSYPELLDQSANQPLQPGVHRLDPSSGKEVGPALPVPTPTALAVDSHGDVFAVQAANSPSGFPPHYDREVLEFDPAGTLIARFAHAEFRESTGIAASTACGIEGTDIFLGGTLSENVLSGRRFGIRLYGPPPTDFQDPCSPPPRVPPTIRAQHAVSVDTRGATVAAQIDPHFWADTSFYVEYGTGKCAEGGCDHKARFPGSQLGAGVLEAFASTKGVFLGASEPLQPDTTYHYRFVARSSGGGPVYGEDPDGEGPEQASAAAGTEATFHTFPLPYPAKSDCPNQAYRVGPSAALPDCRAYEMVSPPEKGHAEVDQPSDGHALSSASGDAVAFSALGAAFAEPRSAPLFPQLLSYREAGGWRTRSIDPPRELPLLIRYENDDPQFKAFDPELCSGWLYQASAPALVPGAPEGVPNLYRQTGLHPGCGEASAYTLLTSVAPPGFNEEVEPGDSLYYPEAQGFSADGQLTLLRAPAKLTAEASDALLQQLYVERAGQLHLVSALPGGRAAPAHATAGSKMGGNASFRFDSLQHAVSTDGSRVFWSYCASASGSDDFCTHSVHAQATGSGNGPYWGPLYVRVNPTAAPSTRATAYGSGSLSAGSTKVNSLLAAEGTGDISSGSTLISGLSTSLGHFQPGQPLSPVLGKIPGGTTVVAVDEAAHTLTLSQPATATASSLSLKSPGPAPFAVGQRISGPGIPEGTTIEAAEAGKLTLSAQALASQAQAPLEAYGPCTDAAAACTYPISEAPDSFFAAASADGSTALYTSGEALYEADVDKLIGEEAGARTEIAGEVAGVMGASEDASRVYFASGEVCSGEAENSAGAKAQPGLPNLYLYQRGESCAAGQLDFIGTLSGADLNTSSTGQPPQKGSPLSPSPDSRSSRVAPDGRFAAFTSAAPLTGYDNADAGSGEADAEVFVFDAGSGKLVCASCNPSGALPEGRDAPLDPRLNATPTAAQLPGWPDQLHASRLLSADGSRLFFESYDSLLPRDTNGREDVYEWERAGGRADCEERIGGELYVPQSEGCLSLISSGSGAEDAHLIDASADGRDVFFTTDAGLVAEDTGLRDVYDARAGGGFPARPAAAAECQGEACQSPPTAPQAQSPSSASFHGFGNLSPAAHRKRCPKARQRRHGRCGRRHHRHHRKQRRPQRRSHR